MADEPRHHIEHGEAWLEYDRWEEDGLTYVLFEGATHRNRGTFGFQIIGASPRPCFVSVSGRHRDEMPVFARSFARTVLQKLPPEET